MQPDIKRDEAMTVSYKQPSLQELAAKKALSKILDPSFEASDFEPLEPRLQELLFGKLRDEIAYLKAYEDAWHGFGSGGVANKGGLKYRKERSQKKGFQAIWLYANDNSKLTSMDEMIWKEKVR